MGDSSAWPRARHVVPSGYHGDVRERGDEGDATWPLLRYMRRDDIPAVATIDQDPAAESWTAATYARELENAAARYIVVEAMPGYVAGLAGAWLIVDELHVITVAVRVPDRGRALGALLVHGLITIAREHGLSVATLECRVSNDVARALYRRFGFHDVGLRRRYYADGEDAVIMTTEALDSEGFARYYVPMLEGLKQRFPEGSLTIRGEPAHRMAMG